jgi:DNA replication protein DnaC
MDHSVMPSSLTLKLKKIRANQTALTSNGCALKSECPQCISRGYMLGPKGAYLAAELCQCFKNCPTCFGKGHRLVEERWESCSVKNPLRTVNLLNEAHIPARYVNAELASFQNYSGNGRQVVQQLQRWQNNFEPSRSAGLVLTGGVGVGKTYLLAAIAKQLAIAGYTVHFADFFQLLGDLKQGYADGKADPTIIEPLVTCDVLVIDELGKGRCTDWEISVADSLISERYNRNRCLIASTNYTLTPSSKPKPGATFDFDRDTSRGQMNAESFGSLEQRLGPRIFSRLKEMTFFCELTGDDFRKH